MKKLVLAMGLALIFSLAGCSAIKVTTAVVDVFTADPVIHTGEIAKLSLQSNPDKTLVEFKDGFSYLVPGHPLKQPGEQGKIIKTDDGFKLE